MLTAKQLRDSVLNQIWVSGIPENLVNRAADAPHIRAPYELLFDETLAEIAKHVPCERTRNVDATAFLSTFFKGGMTVIDAPRGVIRRVYTVANGNHDDPVFYEQVNWPEPESWGRNAITSWVNPTNTGVTPALPLGFKRAEATLDRDEDSNEFGRARAGVWAIHDERLWVSPWLQSNEVLYVEWRGIKKTWGDNDLVNDDLDYRKAVYLYMKYGHERDYGDAQKAALLHQRMPDGRFIGQFDEALADLIEECRKRTALQPRQRQYAGERARLTEELTDDEVP